VSDSAHRRLVDALGKAAKAFDAAQDDGARLDAMIATTRALVVYHTQDAELVGRLRTLGAVESALNDLRQGAVVAVVDHPPVGSKPTATSVERVQATLAWALELLTGPGKMGTELAAREVAEAARKQKLTDAAGSAVTAKQIMSWRKNLRGGRGATWAAGHWSAFRGEYQPLFRMPASDLKVVRARQAAERLVRVVAQVSPRSAPTAKPHGG
jgi:hypothetical protein